MASTKREKQNFKKDHSWTDSFSIIHLFSSISFLLIAGPHWRAPIGEAGYYYY